VVKLEEKEKEGEDHYFSTTFIKSASLSNDYCLVMGSILCRLLSAKIDGRIDVGWGGVGRESEGVDPKVLRNTNSVMKGKGGERLDMWEGIM